MRVRGGSGMTNFENFEKTVVSTLVKRHMEPERIDAVLDAAKQVLCEMTGVGYFLTVRHPSLPVRPPGCIRRRYYRAAA